MCKFFLVRNCSIILLFFADEEIEMQRGRDLPKVKEQVSGRPEIRLAVF